MVVDLAVNNGTVDLGTVHLDTPQPRCASQGVCALTAVPLVCVNGTWTCDYTRVPHIELMANGQLPEFESSFACQDGLDNNCDGRIDNCAP